MTDSTPLPSKQPTDPEAQTPQIEPTASSSAPSPTPALLTPAVGTGKNSQPPLAPVSRLKSHLAAIALGLTFTPLALIGLTTGMVMMISALSRAYSGESSFVAILTGLGVMLLGGVCLALVATGAALLSSWSLVAGALWPGIFALPITSHSLNHLGPQAQPDTLLANLQIFHFSSFFPAIFVIMLGGAMAARYARETGRTVLRLEWNMQRRSLPPRLSLPGRPGAAAPGTLAAPPPSRLISHVWSTAAAIVLGFLGLFMQLFLNQEFFVRAFGKNLEPSRWEGLILALLFGALCLATTMVLGVKSSLAPQVAGMLWGVLAGLVIALSSSYSAVSTPGWLQGAIGDNLAVIGIMWIGLGIAMVCCGAACHWARRHGAELERQEIARTIEQN